MLNGTSYSWGYYKTTLFIIMIQITHLMVGKLIIELHCSPVIYIG